MEDQGRRETLRLYRWYWDRVPLIATFEELLSKIDRDDPRL